MADIINEIVGQVSGSNSDNSGMAPSQEVSVESEDMAPEEKSMLLLDVVQASLMLALDGGISADSKSLSFSLEDDGSIVITGIDQEGTELQVAVPMEDILSALEDWLKLTIFSRILILYIYFYLTSIIIIIKLK